MCKYQPKNVFKFSAFSVCFVLQVYDWQNKNTILSSFNWGYVIIPLFAAFLARKYSPKKLLMFAMTVNAFGCMAIPLSASILGSYGVVACRIMQGLAQGFFAPLSYIILAAWSPLSERSTLTASVLNGEYIIDD